MSHTAQVQQLDAISKSIHYHNKPSIRKPPTKTLSPIRQLFYVISFTKVPDTAIKPTVFITPYKVCVSIAFTSRGKCISGTPPPLKIGTPTSPACLEVNNDPTKPPLTSRQSGGPLTGPLFPPQTPAPATPDADSRHPLVT